MAAKSSTEFYAADGGHTRIAFVRDAGGKVLGAVLNPGPRQQKGVRAELALQGNVTNVASWPDPEVPVAGPAGPLTEVDLASRRSEWHVSF